MTFRVPNAESYMTSLYSFTLVFFVLSFWFLLVEGSHIEYHREK